MECKERSGTAWLSINIRIERIGCIGMGVVVESKTVNSYKQDRRGCGGGGG